jgi:branched-chain amino acid transport system ATP-binding protein
LQQGDLSRPRSTASNLLGEDDPMTTNEPRVTTEPPALLELDDIHVDYEGIISALRGVSLRVGRGEIVALLGSNGAGKTTTLKAASGLLEAERGAITRGSITFDGQRGSRLDPRRLVQAGLVQVLEGRRCFAHLTVHENLVSGALVRRASRAQAAADAERIYALFPRLSQRIGAAAGLLSGGEQQMLAIGRALMVRPRLLLLDEPSIGLAPQIVQEIFDVITQLNRRDGVSVLLAEQNARLALRHAHRAVVLENGRVALSGNAAELSEREDVKRFYLGHAGSDQGRLRALESKRRAATARAD